MPRPRRSRMSSRGPWGPVAIPERYGTGPGSAESRHVWHGSVHGCASRRRGSPTHESAGERGAGGLGQPRPTLFGLEVARLHAANTFFGQELGEHVSHGSVAFVSGETGATSSMSNVRLQARLKSTRDVVPVVTGGLMGSARSAAVRDSGAYGRRRPASAGGRSALSENARAESGHVGDAEDGLGSVHDREGTTAHPTCRTINATGSAGGE